MDKKTVHLHYTTQRRKRRGFQRIRGNDTRKRGFVVESIQDTYKKDSEDCPFFKYFCVYISEGRKFKGGDKLCMGREIIT